MAKPVRHLHRDYHRAFCGRDASHILMTYDESATTCAGCKTALAKTKTD